MSQRKNVLYVGLDDGSDGEDHAILAGDMDGEWTPLSDDPPSAPDATKARERLAALIAHCRYQAHHGAPITPAILNEMQAVLDML